MCTDKISGYKTFDSEVWIPKYDPETHVKVKGVDQLYKLSYFCLSQVHHDLLTRTCISHNINDNTSLRNMKMSVHQLIKQ